VEIAEPARFDTRLVLVWVATALALLAIYWFAREWSWNWELAIPLMICALPLVSRRGRTSLAGVACTALTLLALWTA
jgi:hypothetical protein